MKIAVAAMMQETNTFSHQRTELADFTVARGDAVYGVQTWKNRAVFGILDTLAALGYTVAPGYCAIALPGALIRREAFETIRDSIVADIRAAMPLDGVCLALHGSMAAEGYDDPEGTLLTAIREAVGWEIPITCALDMHTTATETMAVYCNGYSAYHTAPHIDEYETGERAARLMHTACHSGRKLTVKMVKLPILIAGEQTESDEPPMRDLLAAVPSLTNDPGVLDASYVLGYPWADSPYAGVTALVTGYADAGDALAACAHRMADAFDAARAKFAFTTEACTLAQAVALALQETRKPVVISDSGDNPTAGASQDLAIVAKALLDAGATDALVVAIADAVAYAACEAAGEGHEVELQLGRLDAYRTEPPSPLHLKAVVEKIAFVGQGDYAVVRSAGVSIVISRTRVSVAEPFDMRALGLPLEEYRILCVKCGYLDPTYKAFAARSLLALTPGYTCEELDTLPHRRVPRPMFPLDR